MKKIAINDTKSGIDPTFSGKCTVISLKLRSRRGERSRIHSSILPCGRS